MNIFELIEPITVVISPQAQLMGGVWIAIALIIQWKSDELEGTEGFFAALFFSLLIVGALFLLICLGLFIYTAFK